jgi:uncharacterized protein with HEPN domain
MQRDDAVLVDILNACRLAEQFIQGVTKSAFTKDVKTQSSVLHQITIVGEAARRLSTAFRQQNSHIPWQLIIGMRSKLIHEYNSIDLIEVWATVKTDIPSLIAQIESLLEKPKD